MSPSDRNQSVGAVVPKSKAASATVALGEAGLDGITLVDEAQVVAAGREESGGGPSWRLAAMSALLLAAVFAVLAAVSLPAEARVVGAVTAAIAGALLGVLVGLFVTMSGARRGHFNAVETGPHEVLIVVDARDQTWDAEQILLRHGGRIIGSEGHR